MALVQLQDGASLAPSEVREHVAGTLARFKAPRAGGNEPNFFLIEQFGEQKDYIYCT